MVARPKHSEKADGAKRASAANSGAGSGLKYLRRLFHFWKKPHWMVAAMLALPLSSSVSAQTGAEPTKLSPAKQEAARKQATEYLNATERASQRGKTIQAGEMAKRLKPYTEFLSTEDRLRFAKLEQSLKAQGPVDETKAKAYAQGKLKQARELLRRGDWKTAESLAREVESMGLSYGPREDSPKQLRVSIGQATGDPKWLLNAGRAALKAGKLNEAERMVRRAEQLKGTFTFPFWGDTPGKALKDIQVARKSQSLPPGGSEAASLPKGSPKEQKEEALRALAQCREAIKKGDLGKAETLLGKAMGYRVSYAYYDDNPVKVRKELDHARALAGKPKLTTTVEAPKPGKIDVAAKSPAQRKAIALGLLAEGRRALAEGKLEVVERKLNDVRTVRVESYGFFDDTPNKLAEDLADARKKRDRAEADKLLVEARKLFKAGKLDEAEKAAVRSEELHGPYSQFAIFGDRPDKLLAEIKAVRKDNPELAKPKLDPTKVRAIQLVAEAQGLMSQGKLVAARKKALEAQALKAKFSPNEASPELMLRDLASAAKSDTERMVRAAFQQAVRAPAGSRGASIEQAEAKVKEARAIAKAFGQDVTEIEASLKQLSQLKATNNILASKPGTATVTDTPPLPVGADPQGTKMLEQARTELKRGQPNLARKLAEQAYGGDFGVRDQAAALLRAIDAEEHNQKRLAAARAFDGAVVKFNQRDYLVAYNMVRQIDVDLLDDTRMERLKSIMRTSEMAGVARMSYGNPTGTKDPKTELLPPDQELIKRIGGEEPGKAVASDGGPRKLDPLEEAKQMETILAEKLRKTSLEAQQNAAARFRAGDMEMAVELLEDFLTTLRESQLSERQMAVIRRSAENRLNQYRVMKTQKEAELRRNGESVAVKSKLKQDRLNRQNREKQIAELMEQYQSKYKEAKYTEALVLARKAKELEPNNPLLNNTVMITERMINLMESRERRKKRGDTAMRILNDAESLGEIVGDKNPLHIDPAATARSRLRGGVRIPIAPPKSKGEKVIESQMTTPVTLNFEDVPLRDAIEQIRQEKGITIAFDDFHLQKEGISIDRPVTLKVDQISLKSAMNILLEKVGLKWVIKNEALMVTTVLGSRGQMAREIYPVTDLITPVQNFTLPVNQDLQHTLEQANNVHKRGPINNPGVSPFTGPTSLPGGFPAAQPGSEGSESMASSGSGVATWDKRGMSHTMHEQLKQLIVNAVEPGAWDQNGGAGTIDYFPLGGAMVINQTQDIQEQVADLLDALRRLQDQEVAIEVRFITIADGFFERIGLDFSMNIKTNNQTRRFEPQITTGQFAPAPFINDFSPSRLIVGTTPAGTFTSDLDIPIRPTSFGRAIPPFGGFPNSPGDNGGISLGLAFLSDIQVFMFMEAAQGDQRTNVMQAPKLTMFNGQTATLSVQNQQFFVTNVTAVQNGGQLAFLPANQNFATGVQLTLQAVISADRRFVRVSLTPTLTNLASAIVPLFPIVTAVQPFFEGVGNVGAPTLFTQFIQQPVFSSVTVQTTVVVPDGGTVLLGGLKRLSEGRNEFGPPILSKLPYINRLFKNVGYGRETESLLLMVTPRIIINEEEETIQTGVQSRPQLAQ